MSSLTKICCAVCGNKAPLLTRTKLHDKTVLCRSCANKTPSFQRKDLKKRYALSDYKSLTRYTEYAREKLLPKFQPTNTYYTIHLDRNNGLFCFGRTINEKTLPLQLENVTSFDLAFKADGYRESFSGLYVYGKIIMGIELKEPRFYQEIVIAAGIRAPARKVMHNTKISYDNPPGMDDFLELFLQACYESQQRAAYRTEVAECSPFTNGASSELQQAMALFMIDRIEDLTPEQIRTQRNRLIKAFHPDKGSVTEDVYAQKINNAYEILVKYLG